MNLNTDVEYLANLNLPILCLDTCCFLDVIRDITKESVTHGNSESGIHLLVRTEEGKSLIVLMAEQVSKEMSANEGNVRNEANVALKKFRAQATRINEVAALFCGNGSLQLTHLDNHIDRASDILDRWKDVSYLVPQSDNIPSLAYSRVMEPRTPSRQGKDSFKDCVVIETYLDIASKLRIAGLSSTIVFASSNTKDYYSIGKSQLPEDIAGDFNKYSIFYAPNFGAARYMLAGGSE